MAFASEKQRRYMHMHHPSIAKRWEKEYKKGGKVEDYKKGGKVACYAQGGYNTDTVPAMLTPGEVVLNQDQQERLGNMMAGGGKAGGGQARAAALFKHIGVPGYQGGGMANLKMDRHTLMSMGIEDPSSKTTPGEVENKFADLSYTPYGKKSENKKDALMAYYMGGKVKKKKKKRGY